MPGFRAKTLFKASMCYKTFHGLPVEDYAASETPSVESSSGQAKSAVPGEVALIESHGRREFTYNWRSRNADVMVSMWKAQDGRMNGSTQSLTCSPMHLQSRPCLQLLPFRLLAVSDMRRLCRQYAAGSYHWPLTHDDYVWDG